MDYLGTKNNALDLCTQSDLIDLAAVEAIVESSSSIVDVFIYDTSKDSDGGAWRERCQDLSWYNETLNTSTRGATKKFPAVALIVAETNNVTIYDATDPAVPMWMVFNAVDSSAATWWRDIILATSVSMINGQLSVGTNLSGVPTASNGLNVVSFLSDKLSRYSAVVVSGGGVYNGVIADREIVDKLVDASYSLIIDYYINDVAMTVLPDSPIDPATGIRVPTIACLVGESLVSMGDGTTKRIDQVEIGDTVNTLEGSNKVLNWFDQGLKEVIELEFDDGKILTCTADHKIRTDGGWVEAGSLTSEVEVISI